MQDENDELLLLDEAPDKAEGEEEIQPDLSGDDLILDDEPELEEGTDLPNLLRRELREAQKERALLRKRVAEYEERAAPVIADIGPKPTMAEYDFDEVAWGAAVDKWSDDKVKVALQKASTKTPDQAIQEEFQSDVQRYNAELSELPYADKDDVLKVAQEALPDTHKVTLVQVAKNPGKLQYALGKSPALMESLLAIKSPVKLAAELVRIEEKLNMRSQKKPPAPSSTIKGNASAPSADKTLARLEKQASDTGNRSELVKYKKANGLL